MASSLVVCQHNILSSLWLTREYGLLSCASRFRETSKRHEITVAYLGDIRADIYCLAEVDEQSYRAFRSSPLFANDYYSCFCSNSPVFWDEWRRPEKALMPGQPWMPNGTSIFLNLTKFSQVSAEQLALPDGCSACLMSATYRDKSVLIVAIHLDNTPEQRKQAGIELDPFSNRTLSPLSSSSLIPGKLSSSDDLKDIIGEARNLLEEQQILSYIATKQEQYDLVIVAGDWNKADISAFTNAGFLELPDISTPNTEENTSTSLEHNQGLKRDKFTGSASPERTQTTPIPQGAIDHTLIYMGYVANSLIGQSRVLHQGPIAKSLVELNNEICRNVSENGSDHYATVTTLRL